MGNMNIALVQGAALWGAVIFTAFLVRHFGKERPQALRRILLPALLFTTTGVASAVIPEELSPHSVTVAVGHVEWLLLRILFINAIGLVLFDVVLPRVTSLSRIAHELSIGAAYLVLILFFLRRFGVDFSSLLATSAVVTAIVAISMQATLGNAFGGLTLQLDQSIREGDWVRLDDGTEGRVQSVRWRHTVIETRNWDTIIVPNSLLMGQKFMLLGKREGQPQQHRMWVYFNVDFRSAPADVIEAVQIGLRSAPIAGVATTPAPNCVCMDFVQPESAVRYAVRYWLTDLSADDPTSSLVRGRIYAALRRAKIPLAVPAATLFLENHDTAASERKAEKRFMRRLEAVRRLPLCRSLTPEEQEIVARKLKLSPYAAGEIISQEGAPARWLYILDKGTVDIRIAHDHRELSVNSLTAPNYFGEHGMLTGSPRTATVVASSEVECFRLDRETFSEVLQPRPEIASDMAELLVQRQDELSRFRVTLEKGDEESSRADRHLQLLGRIQDFFGLTSSQK